MDTKILPPAQDSFHHALSGNPDSFDDPEVIYDFKELSLDLRPLEAAKFSPGSECTTPGESNSELEDDPIVIVGMGITDFQPYLAAPCLQEVYLPHIMAY